MNKRSFACMAVLLPGTLGLLACSPHPDQGDAKTVAAGVAHTMAATSGATDKACKLFSRDEISAALGTSVDEARDWSAGGCEWRAGDKAMQVQIVPARYWEPLARSAGGESLPGIARQAFVGPWLDSSRAGARMDADCVYVVSPARDISVKLLRTAVQRMASH